MEDREPSRKGRVTGAEGQGLVEYALVLVLVAVALVGSVGAFGTQLIVHYTWVASQIP